MGRRAGPPATWQYHKDAFRVHRPRRRLAMRPSELPAPTTQPLMLSLPIRVHVGTAFRKLNRGAAGRGDGIELPGALLRHALAEDEPLPIRTVPGIALDTAKIGDDP